MEHRIYGDGAGQSRVRPRLATTHRLLAILSVACKPFCCLLCMSMPQRWDSQLSNERLQRWRANHLPNHLTGTCEIVMVLMITTEIMHPCSTVTTTPLLAIFTRLFTKKSLVTRKNSPPARKIIILCSRSHLQPWGGRGGSWRAWCWPGTRTRRYPSAEIFLHFQ